MAKQKILLGITGGIAAYKTPDLVRKLLEANYDVKVVTTKNALAFVSRLTLETLLPRKVYCDFIEPEMQHIKLAKWADTILIAPITANSMAKICYGFADDLLSAICLVAKAPIIMVPAMNQAMWHHVITQENILKLKTSGVLFIGPESGDQACGDEGLGRMTEPADIVAQLENILGAAPDLTDVRILISMGGTQEPIDPVRFICNKSSGKMGYALAQAAFRAKANVTAICGNMAVDSPPCHKLVSARTAKEMSAAVHSELANHDIFISVAAVSDYEVEAIALQKIKRNKAPLTLKLQPTEDILSAVCQKNPRPFVVGFAAETENIINNAKNKLHRKNVDMLVVNDVSQTSIGFSTDENAVSVLYKNNDEIKVLEKATKQRIAKQLLVLIYSAYQDKLSKYKQN